MADCEVCDKSFYKSADTCIECGSANVLSVLPGITLGLALFVLVGLLLRWCFCTSDTRAGEHLAVVVTI